MSNITMEDFIDECLTGKRKPKKKRVLEDKTVDLKKIFEEDDRDSEKPKKKKSKSIVDTDQAKEKNDDEDNIDDVEKEEEAKEGEKIVEINLIIGEKEYKPKVYMYEKEENSEQENAQSVVNRIPKNMAGLLKIFDVDYQKLAQNPIDSSLELKVKEFWTSSQEEVSVILTNVGDTIVGQINGLGETIIHDTDPDPLVASMTTFDNIYKDRIIRKLNKEIQGE